MTLVRADHDAGVLTLTLDSPHNRNALSTALVDELVAHLSAAATDPACRVIVLTHAGPVFCSGADLREAAAGSSSRLGTVLTLLWESPQPVVARVAGPARAGGLGLVAAADIAVCSAEVTFAFTEVRLGVIPAIISATVLPRLTSRAAAALYLTGDTFTADQAASIGLVTAAVPPASLDATIADYVSSLLRGAPGALAAAKALLRRGQPPLADTVAELTALSATFFDSDEGREGLRAFAEKRAPAWVPPPAGSVS